MDPAFQYVINNNGIDDDTSYPYTSGVAPPGSDVGVFGACAFNPMNVAARVKCYTDVSGEDNLLWAVGMVGPVSVAMDAKTKAFKFYKSGVFNDNSCVPGRLNHAMLAVGYATDPMNGDYWIVKNSWGISPRWSNDGYILVARGSNLCGIASRGSYAQV